MEMHVRQTGHQVFARAVHDNGILRDSYLVGGTHRNNSVILHDDGLVFQNLFGVHRDEINIDKGGCGGTLRLNGNTLRSSCEKQYAH